MNRFRLDYWWKVFSFFRPRWFFLKGFTKEFPALKSRIFYPNCTFFSGATLLAFLYFLRFFSFVFCNGLLYIWNFYFFVFTQHTKTVSNLENCQFSIGFSWKCYFFTFWHNFVCCVKTQKIMQCLKNRYTAIQRKKQNQKILKTKEMRMPNVYQ